MCADRQYKDCYEQGLLHHLLQPLQKRVKGKAWKVPQKTAACLRAKSVIFINQQNWKRWCWKKDTESVSGQVQVELNYSWCFLTWFLLTSRLSSKEDAAPSPGEMQAGIARRQQGADPPVLLQKKGLGVHKKAVLGYLSSGPQTISFTSTGIASSNKAFLYLQAISSPF